MDDTAKASEPTKLTKDELIGLLQCVDAKWQLGVHSPAESDNLKFLQSKLATMFKELDK